MYMHDQLPAGGKGLRRLNTLIREYLTRCGAGNFLGNAAEDGDQAGEHGAERLQRTSSGDRAAAATDAKPGQRDGEARTPVAAQSGRQSTGKAPKPSRPSEKRACDPVMEPLTTVTKPQKIRKVRKGSNCTAESPSDTTCAVCNDELLARESWVECKGGCGLKCHRECASRDLAAKEAKTAEAPQLVGDREARSCRGLCMAWC